VARGRPPCFNEVVVQAGAVRGGHQASQEHHAARPDEPQGEADDAAQGPQVHDHSHRPFAATPLTRLTCSNTLDQDHFNRPSTRRKPY
jgi:hypothetical protein